MVLFLGSLVCFIVLFFIPVLSLFYVLKLYNKLQCMGKKATKPPSCSYFQTILEIVRLGISLSSSTKISVEFSFESIQFREYLGGELTYL